MKRKGGACALNAPLILMQYQLDTNLHLRYALTFILLTISGNEFFPRKNSGFIYVFIFNFSYLWGRHKKDFFFITVFLRFEPVTC